MYLAIEVHNNLKINYDLMFYIARMKKEDKKIRVKNRIKQEKDLKKTQQKNTKMRINTQSY